MRITILCVAAELLLLSQCHYAEQLAEDRRLDAEYDAYYAERVPESRALAELKAVARQASAARVKKMYASDKPDEFFVFAPAELKELKVLMASLQDLPPVERETWKAAQRESVVPPLPYWFYFTDLEFLDAGGKVLGCMSLTCGIASAEEAEEYRFCFRVCCPDYMLPREALVRFKALPPLRKADK